MNLSVLHISGSLAQGGAEKPDIIHCLHFQNKCKIPFVQRIFDYGQICSGNYLFKNKSEVMRMGENANRYVESVYSADGHYEKLMEAFRKSEKIFKEEIICV